MLSSRTTATSARASRTLTVTPQTTPPIPSTPHLRKSSQCWWRTCRSSSPTRSSNGEGQQCSRIRLPSRNLSCSPINTKTRRVPHELLKNRAHRKERGYSFRRSPSSLKSSRKPRHSKQGSPSADPTLSIPMMQAREDEGKP